MTRRQRWFDPLGDVGPERHVKRVPPPVSEALRALAARRGWQAHLTAGDLGADWASIVGAQLASHTAPLRLQGGVLVLAASSPMWAAEVRQHARMITQRVNERCGDGTVTQVTVTVRQRKGL